MFGDALNINLRDALRTGCRRDKARAKAMRGEVAGKAGTLRHTLHKTRKVFAVNTIAGELAVERKRAEYCSFVSVS